MKKKWTAALFTLLLVLACCAAASAAAASGDLNGDGRTDSSDLELLASHLSGEQPLEEALLAQADLDGNGLVDVQDLSLLALRAEAKAMPSVSVTSVSDSEQDASLSVSLSVQDEDGALASDLKISLKAPDGAVVHSWSAAPEALPSPLSYPGVEEEEYTLEVRADYSLNPNRVVEDALLLTQKLPVTARFLERREPVSVRVLGLRGGAVEEAYAGQVTEETKREHLVELRSPGMPVQYAAIRSVLPDGRLELAGEGFVSYENGKRRPGTTVSYPYTASEPPAGGLFVPALSRLEQLEGYDPSFTRLYHNLSVLMPWYDAKYLVEDAPDIPRDSLLQTEELRGFLLLDENHRELPALTDRNYREAASVCLVFSPSGSMEEYPVSFRSFRSGIASYEIPALGTSCNLGPAVLESGKFAEAVRGRVEGYTYGEDLFPAAGGAKTDEYSLYEETYERGVEGFRPAVREESASIASHLAQEWPECGASLEHPVLDALRAERLDRDSGAELKKLLFAYTYFTQWYSVDLNGLNLRDAVLFRGGLFGTGYGVQELVDGLLSLHPEWRSGNATTLVYQAVLASRTGRSLPGYLEYFVQEFCGYSDPNDWFADTFPGVLLEVPLDISGDTVAYRAWDYIKNNDFMQNGTMILPLLSLPSDELYVLSCPTQLMVGSMNVYWGYSSQKETDKNAAREAIRGKLEAYGVKLKRYYTTVLQLVDGQAEGNLPGAEVLNSCRQMEFDARTIGEDLVHGTPQGHGNATDPVIKYLYCPLDTLWTGEQGPAAYANAQRVFWITQALLDNFQVLSHETAHMQDEPIFLLGLGDLEHGNQLRKLTGSEDYAEGMLAQGSMHGSSNGLMHFNFADEFGPEDSATQNLSPERIASPEKAQDFYRKMFEVLNTLDYLEGQAFLRLTPKQQSDLALQHTYDGPAAPADAAKEISYWRMRTPDEFQAMDLSGSGLAGMEKLWDHQIMILQVHSNFRVPTESYGGPDTSDIYWYTPHNELGRPNSYTFKRNAFEMLAEGGYRDGFVAYASSQSANDLEAIRKITGDPGMTWKQYKMDTYRDVESRLSSCTYFDADGLIELFRREMEAGKDASLRQKLYYYLHYSTDDFRESLFEPGREFAEVSSGAEFYQAAAADPTARIRLTCDIDMSAQPTIPGDFSGQVAGNGFRITGIRDTKPLFYRLKYAYLESFEIPKTSYPEMLVARNTNSGILSDIRTAP